MTGFYAEDLAHVHDTGWGEFARRTAPGLIDRLRAEGIQSGLVVDLACGSGILDAELVAAGYDVLGVDISPDMLAIARRRAPGARFVEASVVDAEIPPCAAVVSIGEGLGYLHDPRIGDDERLRSVFRRVREALAPGGLFLFDLVEVGMETHRWVEGPDWFLCVQNTVTPATIERRINLFREHGGAYRRSEERHVARCLPRERILADLAACGFAAETIPFYTEGHPLLPGVVAYAAR